MVPGAIGSGGAVISWLFLYSSPDWLASVFTLVFFPKFALGTESCKFVNIYMWGDYDWEPTIGFSAAFMKSALTSSISTSRPVVGSVTVFLVPETPADRLDL